jgi:DEAD/DEAH box helicase domain-containing protein
LGLALGGLIQTDVFQLELRDLASGRPITDRAACTAIAIALRQALARRLGVEPREIGWSTSTVTFEGLEARPITLFDASDGGAGYVIIAGEQLATLLKDARAFLECSQGCDAACHACLLAFDTQHEVGLDRHAGLQALPDALLAAMALPPELQVFGETTRMEMQPLTIALLRELRQSEAQECRIFLGDSIEDWIFDEWPLWPHLVRWRADGLHVTPLMPDACLGNLDYQEANSLWSRAEATGIKIAVTKDSKPAVGGFPLLAEVATARGHVRWVAGSATAQVLAPGGEWAGGASGGTLRGRSSGVLVATPSRLVSAQELRKAAPGTFKELTIAAQTDGDLTTFGQRFWKVVAAQVAGLEQKLQSAHVVEVRWNDRYIRSPLIARALYEVLRALVRSGGATGVVSHADPLRISRSDSRQGSGGFSECKGGDGLTGW